MRNVKTEMENNKKITSFKDLEVYKLSRQFRNKIYELTKSLPSEEKYNLVDQMRRASLSVTSNIAEGYGRYHYQENIQFCRQATKVSGVRSSIFTYASYQANKLKNLHLRRAGFCTSSAR